MKAVYIVIIAKAPLAGYAKTRLIPALGADGAARLARKMLFHTVQTAIAANIGSVELCTSPAPGDAVWKTFELPTKLRWSTQGEGDLGERMARAAARTLQEDKAVLLIGTDCPAIDTHTLREVALALRTHDACMIPTFDGGYALLALNQYDASLFTDVPWSTDTVAQITLSRIQTLNWTCKLLPTLHDIDEAADLAFVPKDWLK